MTLYLCTCGTSAAKKIPRQPEPFSSKWVRSIGGVQKAAEAVYATFEGYRMADEEALTKHLSAEIHSLARMGLTARDRIVLFSSETEDGQAAAEAVALYLRAEHPGLDCAVETVSGLQVTDAEKFRTLGVLEFVKCVVHWIGSFGAAQCVLNPTGGFKSLVPYTVIIGMMKNVPARYVFEQSATLIDLPQMPLEFARERIEPVRSLIERIDRESAIPKSDYEAALTYREQQELGALFESLGNQVTLSPVGFLIWEETQAPSALAPYLSRMALDDLLQLRKDGIDPETFLLRVAGDSGALQAATHDTWGEGFIWLKPGNTRDRYLVSVDEWRLLVWRMVLHPKDYEALLQSHRESPQPQKMLKDQAKYAPFVRMDLYEGPVRA